MARYKMTVVFEVHEEVEMKYVYRGEIGTANTEPPPYEALKGIERNHPHINEL